MMNSENGERVIIHIYADGRGFVICPVHQDDNGQWREYQPVQRISLTLGYPTTYYLSRAIEKACAQSTEGSGEKWDGDAGRWWAHHLLALAIVESADELALSNLGEDTAATERAALAHWPADAPVSEVAECIVEQLRKALSA